jgi:phage gp16-like protein
MPATSTAHRRGMLAKIHIAIKDLGLSDADYRAMLNNLFGVDSSAKLTDRQLHDLLGHLTSRGFTGRKTGDKAAPDDAAVNRKPMLAKIGALLTVLGQLENRHVPWEYAAGILKRQSGVMHLKWATCAQLRGVIAALARRVDKLERDAVLTAHLNGESR